MCVQGMAVREGMMIARGAYCLFMDADGATRVSDLELLEKALQQVQTPSEYHNFITDLADDVMIAASSSWYDCRQTWSGRLLWCWCGCHGV